MLNAPGEAMMVGAPRPGGGPDRGPTRRRGLPHQRSRAERYRAHLRALAVGAAFGVGMLRAAHVAQGAAWDPSTFASADTLKLRTNAPGEGEHWFKVWLVVLDGQVYVRLGSRAAERVERNTTAPYVGVEAGGTKFEKVRVVPAPEMAEQVAKAMAAKYTSDLLVRWLPHPLTLRLVPES